MHECIIDLALRHAARPPSGRFQLAETQHEVVTAGPDGAPQARDKEFPVLIFECVEEPTVENRVVLRSERLEVPGIAHDELCTHTALAGLRFRQADRLCGDVDPRRLTPGSGRHQHVLARTATDVEHSSAEATVGGEGREGGLRLADVPRRRCLVCGFEVGHGISASGVLLGHGRCSPFGTLGSRTGVGGRTVLGVEPNWVRLRLDLASFDDDAFAPVVEQCERDGIVFRTMTDLGDVEANHRRLYELNRTCSSDIPNRGEFYTYEDYIEQRIRHDYTPATTVVALDGDTWVGLSAASDHSDEGYFFNEMTGVLRSHRGRGIALAMKVIVNRQVREHGVDEIRTFHHPDNLAPIALNRKLGYLDA